MTARPAVYPIGMKRTKGFSIAETLISVFLLALLLIVFFNLFPTTVLANRQGSQQMQAMDLAQSVLSEARTRPFDDLTIGLKESGSVQRIDGTDYQTSLEVVKPDSGDPDQLKVLLATVTWTANNKSKNLQERIWIHRVLEE